jgi:hypothetical protein
MTDWVLGGATGKKQGTTKAGPVAEVVGGAPSVEVRVSWFVDLLHEVAR